MVKVDFLFCVAPKEVENMFFVFLSSYRNTRESLRELQKASAAARVPAAFLILSKSRFSIKQMVNVAVRLFSNRSQMTSKCGKKKKVAHEAIAECVTDSRGMKAYSERRIEL